MRIILSLALATALAACGGKKAPQNPGNSGDNETQVNPEADSNAEQDMNTPDGTEDMAPASADPCEGGE